MLKRTLKAVAGVAHPVIAGYDSEEGMPARLTVAMHRCTNAACGCEVVANKMAATACPTCASSMDVVAEDMHLTAANLRELPSVGGCDTCGTHYHAAPTMAAALDGHQFHCPVCTSIVQAELDEELGDDGGSEMVDDLPLEGAEDLGDDEGDVADLDDSSLDDDAGLEGDMGDGEDADLSELGDADSDMGDDGLSDDSDLGDDLGDEAALGDDAELGDDADLGDDSDLGEDSGLDDAGDLDLGDEDSDVSDLPDEDEGLDDSETVEARLLDYVTDAATLEIVFSGGEETRAFLFADDVPVAIGEKSRAKPTVAAVWGSNKYLHAFKLAASDGLTTEAIEDFGFEPVEVTVPVDQVTKQQTAKAVSEATAALNEKLETVSSVFEQSLGIAAMGVNKGLFNSENPLKDAVIAALTKNRVRNPEHLVESLFQEHGESYLKVIVAKAVELANKTPENRDDYANMVSDAPYRTTASAVDSPPDRRAPVSFMTSASTESAEPAKTAMTDEDEMMAAVASLGRPRV